MVSASTEKRWVIKPLPSGEEAQALATAINVSLPVASMLIQRGINTFEEAKDFFRPSLDHLHDPFLMKDMDRAVARIQQAFDNQEKILVYGDYDVDGTTSVALVYGFLKNHYEHLAFYIPDRYKEGYGVSYKGIDFAKENDFKLIISLDCGIRSVEQVTYALKKGVDFIICDHHIPADILPPAVAVLDAKRLDCEYPYKELSGCGVGFKLMQAMCKSEGWDEELLLQQLDLTAISICADIVPMTGENRVMTYHGLKLINKNPRPGIDALLNIAKIQGEVSVHQLVFGLAPRINAAGRIKHASASVDLMLAPDPKAAQDFSSVLNEHNDSRRSFDSSITEEALEMIAAAEILNAKTTVLYKEDWHKGVIGIVASRCIEKYYRPTIIFTKSDEGKAAGSARSVHGFDVHEAITQCSDLLIQFGGHMYAAGLTIEIDKIEAFQKRFEEVVAATITIEQLVPRIDIDLEIAPDQITDKFFNIVKQMAPFGPGNMQPTFMTRAMRHDGRVRVLKETHLKLVVSKSGSKSLDAIAFGMGECAEELEKNKPFDLCYNIQENTFNGVTNLQLMVKDLKCK